MKNPVFEVKIPLCVDASELAGILDAEDFLGSWEQDGMLVLYWKGGMEGIKFRLQAGLKQLGAVVPETSIRLDVAKEEDWNARWAAAVEPVRIGRRLGIRPSWTLMELPEDGIELILDPGQAFGTGHHATTQLLIEWLEELTWGPDTWVLDVGTGTGILSMAALRFGATFALGIDIDATAIACAKQYAMVNDFKEELEFRACSLAEVPRQKFSVILANLDRRTLMSLGPQLTALQWPDSQLLVSGLLEEDERDMIAAFQRDGWAHRSTRRLDDWIALQFVSSSSGSGFSGRDSK